VNQLSEGFSGNHLNSIWLEGRVIDQPEAVPASLDQRVSFRIHHTNPADHDESAEFEIEAPPWAFILPKGGSLLGRNIRIIGRLSQRRRIDEGGKPLTSCYVVGECVETLELSLG